jgi:hypothetical protein
MKEREAMASRAVTNGDDLSIVKKQAFIEGIKFDRIMVVLSLLFVGGLFLDGWAHNHHFVDQTFFTPWHAVLYSAYLTSAIALAVAIYLNHARGRSWLNAIPRSYELAAIGVPIFAIAGAGDLVWHTVFGFEIGIAPLLSPTHLLLALGGFLIMSGPLRSVWLRTEGPQVGWGALLPAVLSLAAIYSVFTFFTQFANIILESWLVTSQPTNDGMGARGVAGILLMSVVLMGVLLLAMRRWRLPLGSITLIIVINFVLMSVLKDQEAYIPLILIPSLIAEGLLWWIQSRAENIVAWRVFGFVVPFVYNLTFFLTVQATTGIAWTIHLWLGSVFMAGVLGLLMTYLAVPPVVPVEEKNA